MHQCFKFCAVAKWMAFLGRGHGHKKHIPHKAWALTLHVRHPMCGTGERSRYGTSLGLSPRIVCKPNDLPPLITTTHTKLRQWLMHNFGCRHLLQPGVHEYK